MSRTTDSPVTKDPVCGMTVSTASANHKITYHETNYYFCGPSCLNKFQTDPEAFIETKSTKPIGDSAEPSALKKPDKGKRYSCPMHANIVSDVPDNCPICGMALELSLTELASGEHDSEQSEELAFYKKRFLLCLLLFLPLFFIAMSDMTVAALHVNVIEMKGKQRLLEIGQFILATPIIFFGGSTFFARAAASLRNRSPNMFTLIALGILTAYIFSSIMLGAHLFLPEGEFGRLFGATAFDSMGQLKLYFESAAAITTLSLLGQYMELKARQASGKAIRSLLVLAPKSARRVNADGGEEEVSLNAIEVGDLIRIRSGEQIPTDGVLEEGSASIDESMLSGEALPVEKEPGAKLSAGTTNGSSTFTMRSRKRAEDSFLATIVRTVEESQKSRIPAQDMADKVSSVFVPIVIVIAIVTFLAWAIFAQDFSLAVSNAIATLIIACPCALGLATPTSVLVASGVGARHGILIREAEAMEKLERVKILAVDKTGTLTEGKPVVTGIIAAPGASEEAVLRLAASLEQGSEHPLAKSILGKAHELGLKLEPVSHFTYNVGRGLAGNISGQEVLLGSPDFLSSSGIELSDLLNRLPAGSQNEATVLALAVDKRVAGVLLAQDRVKPSSYAALSELAKQGIRVVMLTGDQAQRAQAVATELKLDEYLSELLPADKAQIVRNYRQKGMLVAMAGDGINDAPALAEADVGIAMGDGSGVAVGTAQIVLVKGDLLALTRAVRLAKAMMRNISQNLLLAFGYNVLAIPIAAGVLIPFFKLALDPALASLAMSLSSLSVLGNSLRLRTSRI